MFARKQTTEPFVQGEERWADFSGYRMRYLFVRSQNSARPRPPVVFIHGFLAYSFSWRFNLTEFSEERDVYAVDLLGLGYSDHPPRGKVSFTLRDSALRILQWAKSQGLKNIDLVGTSHGGALAVLMADLDRQQGTGIIGRLVLVAPANPYSKRGRKRLWFFNTTMGALVLKITGGGNGGVTDWALGQMYGDRSKLTKETKNGYRTAMRNPGTLDYVLEVISSWWDDMRQMREALDRIGDIPTLLLWGERDDTVPTKTIHDMQRHFRNVHAVVIPGSGHLTYEEDPEIFNREVLGFLDGPSVAKGA